MLTSFHPIGTKGTISLEDGFISFRILSDISRQFQQAARGDENPLRLSQLAWAASTKAPTSGDPVTPLLFRRLPRKIYLRWSTDTFVTSNMWKPLPEMDRRYSAVIPPQPAEREWNTASPLALISHNLPLSGIIDLPLQPAPFLPTWWLQVNADGNPRRLEPHSAPNGALKGQLVGLTQRATPFDGTNRYRDYYTITAQASRVSYSLPTVAPLLLASPFSFTRQDERNLRFSATPWNWVNGTGVMAFLLQNNAATALAQPNPSPGSTPTPNTALPILPTVHR